MESLMSLRKVIPSVAGIALLLAACADDPVHPVPQEADRSVSGTPPAVEVQQDAIRHVVMFRGAAPRDFEARVAELGGAVALNHRIGIAIVTGLDEAGAALLQRRVNARLVEEEPQFYLIEPTGVRDPVRIDVASTGNPTGAILYGNQWNMHQIHAEGAWAAGRVGSSAVTIAILDTGIDYQLPDLSGRVDLSRSASFVPADDNFVALYRPGRHVSVDLHYHGTNVATQASSNAWAFAGVTSQTTLMSVKVCGVLGGCPGVIEGILHAVDNGADVINMSLGGWFRRSAFPGQVSVINAIMNYARQEGVTVVVSAGNSSNDLDRNHNIAIQTPEGQQRVHIPSFFATYCDAQHVICVSATRRNDESASYTNYGRSAIDVAAPGGDGVTGDWVNSLCPRSSLIFNCAGGLFVIGVAGTSQAAPHVAGLAALIVEDVGRNPAQVRARIRNSADAIGGGNTAYFGRGRVNVAKGVGAGD